MILKLHSTKIRGHILKSNKCWPGGRQVIAGWLRGCGGERGIAKEGEGRGGRKEGFVLFSRLIVELNQFYSWREIAKAGEGRGGRKGGCVLFIED